MMQIERACHKDHQCSIINTSEDMSQVKVFVMGRQMDGRTDKRMSFNIPCFHERRGTIKHLQLFLVQVLRI